MLFWNEGKAVKTERALDEGAGAVVSVEVASVDPANNGKLVHVSGPVSVAAAPSDPLFATLALPTNTIRISRSVEMYQWAESTKIETTRKLGGGEETVTTYSYAKEWSPQHNDSAKFKQPEGHANPDFAISAESFTAERAAIGAFVFEGQLSPRSERTRRFLWKRGRWTAFAPSSATVYGSRRRPVRYLSAKIPPRPPLAT